MLEILAQTAQVTPGTEFKDWIPIIGSCITAVVAIAGLIATFKTTQFVQARNLKTERRKEIVAQLSEFYGPYSTLQGVAKQLSDTFRVSRGQDFPTLLALLGGDKFEGNDRALLEEILKINQARNDLILKYGGLVNNAGLQHLLWRASAHFRIIELAYKANQEGGQGLHGELDRFREYMYPNDLNDRIEEQIRTLQSDLTKLDRV